VCAAWGIEKSRAEIKLITVSENATFVLKLDGKEEGVVRVSQPGYVGGPQAVASEILWLNALHDIDGVRLINPVPTVRGTFVTTIHDTSGIGWTVVSTKFVSGEVLEDLDNPAPYYETIGSWAALFHEAVAPLETAVWLPAVQLGSVEHGRPIPALGPVGKRESE
jgi:hypothetical protein